jgi:hypothetical protein
MILSPTGGGWASTSGTTNQFSIVNQPGTAVKTFTTTIATGVWYRLELEITRGTTTSNGYLAGRVYLGDATTPVEAGYSSSSQNTGTVAGQGNFTDVLFGIIDSAPFLEFEIWIDDLNVADGTTTPIGPSIGVVLPSGSGGGSWS